MRRVYKVRLSLVAYVVADNPDAAARWVKEHVRELDGEAAEGDASASAVEVMPRADHAASIAWGQRLDERERTVAEWLAEAKR